MKRFWPWRSTTDREIDDELAAHLEMSRRDRMARGAAAEAAATGARRELGNATLVAELTREVWGWPALERWRQDVRYAVRMLRRSPGFALVAALSLALGIGANTAAFSMADAALLRPLPVPDPGLLVAIHSESAQAPLDNLSFPDFDDIARRTRAFSGLAASRTVRLALARPGDAVPQVRFAHMVGRDYFQVLGVKPALGRAFTDEESTVPGRDAVVVLSDELWRTQFAADPRVLGTTVRLNDRPFTIVGVAPPAFTGLNQFMRPALFAPITSLLPAGTPSPLEDRSAPLVVVRARLANGVSIERAQEEVASIGRSLAAAFPNSNRARTFRVRTELAARVAETPGTLVIVSLLLTTAALVLFTACANVAGLLLARARARGREMAIRLAIGAGRVRLLRQLLTESLVLALAGGALGVLLANLVIRALASWRLPTDTPIAVGVQLDTRVLGATLFVSVASVVLFGLAPAWRTTSPVLTDALKASEAGAVAKVRLHGRHVLVVSQIALCVIMLVVSAALFDAFRRMILLDPGIRADRVMMVELDPALAGYGQQRMDAFYRDLIERVRALPGVRSATLASSVPFRPNFVSEEIVPEGYAFPEDRRSVPIPLNIVDDSYFATLHTGIVRGRAFAAADTSDAPRVAIVNEEMARRYWRDANAVGRRIRLGVDGPFAEVVGVARTGKYTSLAEAPQPYLYLPLSQRPRGRMTLMAEAQGDARSLAASLIGVVRSLDPAQPVFNVRDFRSYFDQGALGLPRVLMQMVGAAGMAGLVLALVGLYGLVSYSVSRRTRELGIRMAIGATRRDVAQLVLGHGLKLSLAGTLLGVAVSIPVFRLMASGLAGLGGLSAWSLALVPAGLVVVTLSACYLPARRATRIDPTIALRAE